MNIVKREEKSDNLREEKMDLSELRKAIEEVELVDGHAHNLVALHSNLPFIHAFSEAQGDAIVSSQHSLSFKVLLLFQLIHQTPYCTVETAFF